MRAPVAAMIPGPALGACASSSLNLPHKPEVQPSGATISAAYTIVADRLRVEIACQAAGCRPRRHPGG